MLFGFVCVAHKLIDDRTEHSKNQSSPIGLSILNHLLLEDRIMLFSFDIKVPLRKE